MCKWGEIVDVRVRVEAHLSHTGEARYAVKAIDSCIAPIVKALSDAEIGMLASCCGHGKSHGHIELFDGRTLVVKTP